MTHRLYALVLVGLAVVSVAGFGLYGRHFEPLSGDLTRIGWYAENEFGPSLPDHRFSPPLAERGRFDGGYDVIAVGDSFTVDESDREGADWPHFLAQQTGLSIATFDNGIDKLETVLASPAYRDHPPIALVYEIVERSFVPAHRGRGGECSAALPTPRAERPIAPMAAEPREVKRPVARNWDDWPASYAMNFVLQNAIRAFRGHETTTAVRLEMAEGGLFSSGYDRGLLVYAEDFNKLGWSDADWREAICDLVRLQDRVEANGRTAFLAMIVPDKLTVYTPFLTTRRFDGISHLDRLGEVPRLNLVPLAPSLDPRRQVDLYLPDDTHWSGVGYAIAAQQVLAEMLALGVVRR